MFNWLKRLFGGSDSAPAEASEPAPTPAPPPTPSEPPAEAATGEEEPPAAGPA